ncbi:MAG TPA: hypothetical protein VFH92_00380 [Phenylobacterium sp.]|nr:hypothetical protein [Phenylobacterium sp.]
MLHSIDLLIGLSVVMLAVSLVVTLVTQFTVETVNLKGEMLCGGIADLIHLIDHGIGCHKARVIAEEVLRDELVSERMWRGKRMLAPAIHREELIKILLAFASDYRNRVPTDPPAVKEARAALIKSLADNGIAQPKDCLDKIRMVALKLEKSHPELSNSDRANRAILALPPSDFVGMVHGWFDQTIDRVTDRFTRITRMISFAASLVVAAVIELDAINLMNRLAIDDETRQKAVNWAVNSDILGAGDETTIDKLGLVAGTDLVQLPADLHQWMVGFVPHLPGMLLSTILLSLGAPFWYETLKSLLKLRSVVLKKDDAQRKDRQTTQAPA